MRELLRPQRPADFLIKKSVGTVFSATPASKGLTEFLRPFAAALSALPHSARKRLAFHLGARLVRLLQEHFMKFSYSNLGGAQLAEDFRVYASLLQEVGDAESQTRFSDLKLLFTLVMVEPEGLRAYSEEYLLPRFPREMIEEILHKRTDFKSSGLHKLIASLPR